MSTLNERIENELDTLNLSAEERDQWWTFQDREAFAKTYLKDRQGAPWQVRDYQRESLQSHTLRKVHCDGRDVGKTAEIEIIAAWAMVTKPNSEMLIATQCENHLFPLMNRILRFFKSNSKFAPSLVEVKRTPSWYLRFSNGFVLWGRIAGMNGVNFQGLHVDWQIVDEAQEMTETAWGELYQSLNGGGRRWVYGVPNGRRNSFHRMANMKDIEQYNWPSALNPEFDDAKDEELAKLYGGRTAPGYLHRVLGQHGAPAHAVFNFDDYLACVDPSTNFEDIALTANEQFHPPEDVPKGEYYLGCDLGYARDPSEFVVFQADGPCFINVLRVHLEGVNYARQQRIIIELDEIYDFRSIGIDAGNSGRAVAHNLMEKDQIWCDKIQAYEFGGNIELEPLPNGDANKRKIKPLMTELLQRRMAEGTLVFPHMPDREAQYASHTYTLNNQGKVIYDKGDDHIIDADRCAILSHHMDTVEFWEPAPKGMLCVTF